MAEANEADARRLVTLLCGTEEGQDEEDRQGVDDAAGTARPGEGSGLGEDRSLRFGDRAQRMLRATDTRNRPTPAPISTCAWIRGAAA